MSKRQELELGRVDPEALEKVRTVWGNYLYIRKDRKPGRMIPIFTQDGRRSLDKRETHGRVWYRQEYLHPENIMTPFSPPMMDDYVQLLDADGKPSENHTAVFTWSAELGPHLWLIEDKHGESMAITRCESLDNDVRRGWQQVITAVAP